MGLVALIVGKMATPKTCTECKGTGGCTFCTSGLTDSKGQCIACEGTKDCQKCRGTGVTR